MPSALSWTNISLNITDLKVSDFEITLNVQFTQSFYGFSKLAIREGDEGSSGISKSSRDVRKIIGKVKRVGIFTQYNQVMKNGWTKTGSCETPLFCILHDVTCWKEPGTTTRRITVAIILPTGIEPGIVSTEVLDGGRILELNVDWLQYLTNVDMVHKK